MTDNDYLSRNVLGNVRWLFHVGVVLIVDYNLGLSPGIRLTVGTLELCKLICIIL